jgi:hypothetical protein
MPLRFRVFAASWSKAMFLAFEGECRMQSRKEQDEDQD